MRVHALALVFAPASALLLATPVLAQDISPGLWEITVESRVAATPGFAPEPYKLTQCLNAQDARDPSRLLGGLSTQGASNCSLTESSRSGNTLRFAMQCAGTMDLRTRGKVNYSPDAMNGTIDATANLGIGAPVNMQNKVSAKRLGAC